MIATVLILSNAGESGEVLYKGVQMPITPFVGMDLLVGESAGWNQFVVESVSVEIDSAGAAVLCWVRCVGQYARDLFEREGWSEDSEPLREKTKPAGNDAVGRIAKHLTSPRKLKCVDNQGDPCQVITSIRGNSISIRCEGGDGWAHITKKQAELLANWLTDAEKLIAHED